MRCIGPQSNYGGRRFISIHGHCPTVSSVEEILWIVHLGGDIPATTEPWLVTENGAKRGLPLGLDERLAAKGNCTPTIGVDEPILLEHVIVVTVWMQSKNTQNTLHLLMTPPFLCFSMKLKMLAQKLYTLLILDEFEDFIGQEHAAWVECGFRAILVMSKFVTGQGTSTDNGRGLDPILNTPLNALVLLASSLVQFRPICRRTYGKQSIVYNHRCDQKHNRQHET